MAPRVKTSETAYRPAGLEHSGEDAEVRRFVESGELRVPSPVPSGEEAAIAEARQRWHREEAARLADAEIIWAEKYDKRLTIARIAAQRAESALQQVQRELASTRADIEIREKQFSELQSLYAQERDRWNRSPAAAQKQRMERDLQFERRMKIALRLGRDFALTVFIITASVVVGERAAPIIATMLRQETGDHGHIRPLLRKAGVDIPVADTAPQALVSSRIVKLRAEPDSGASVVGRLWRNEAVVPIVSSGSWVLVRIGTEPHQQRGWLPASALTPVNPPLSAAR
jgi:hypothetical protein